MSASLAVARAQQSVALVEYGGPEAELFRDAVGTDIETDVALAQETLVEATKRLRELEAERQRVNRPLLDDKAKVDSMFKPSTTIYETIIETCDETIKADRAAKREAADRALMEAKTQSEIQVIAAPLPKMAGIGTRKSPPKIRVVDESKVPDAFWILDIHALKEEHKAGRAVPGIEFYYDESLVVK